MIKYPKIETLWNRDPKTHKVIPGEFRCDEFKLVNKWVITEKIDGTNIRINYYRSVEGTIGVRYPDCVTFGGRTDNAQLYAPLVKYLQETFTVKKFREVFEHKPGEGINVTLFGEGYGPRIQKGGGNYRSDISFRLIDVFVEPKWWLKWKDVEDIANKFGIKTVPILCSIDCFPKTVVDLAFIIKDRKSVVAIEDGGNQTYCAEGIVARTEPLLLMRNGHRVMWKLKFKDFKETD